MSVDTEAADGPGPPPPVHGKRRSFVAGLVIVALGIALVVLVWRDSSASPATETVTIVPSNETLALWKQHTITSVRPDPAHTMTVVGGSYRVNSTAANTDGNQRELWTLDGDHADVDVTVRIDRPSSLGGAFSPQPGLALRYHDDGNGTGRALIIDSNIWSRNYDRMIIGLWKWPGPAVGKVSISELGAPLLLEERKAGILGVARSAGDPATDVYAVAPSSAPSGPDGFEVGDRVDIATAVDRSYAHRNVEISAIDRDNGLISVRHPGVTSAAPFHTEVGVVKFHYSDAGVDPRAFYPRYVRARIVGSTVQVKSWLVERPEPGWQFSATIPSHLDVPESGRVGLVSNHLHGAGRYIAFGPVTIRPVTTP